ncbi:MAG: zinc metallopeptidase [Christensenellaceae bacterium]|jgi:Zn-dependent membrane protease YugP|nr:zinc metallopeptidase [Christensenellaceae bacterium]
MNIAEHVPEFMYIIGSCLILPVILFALWAELKVSRAFNELSRVGASCDLTGAEIARKLLDENGCSHIEVINIPGHLNDHYDPRKKLVCLSDDVYDSASLAAIGVAAHEVGHAIQHQQKYLPLLFRQIVIKSTSLINKLLMPLIIIGLIASLVVTGTYIMGMYSQDFWFFVIIGFCAMYMISFLVNLITLPTEYNASARAKKLLDAGGYLHQEEKNAVASVLDAAALTYLAGLLVSLAYMLRFLGILFMMFGDRKK